MKMENEDRISDLPDSILIVILSFLSTREAVASSMLSSRWKYLFTFVGNLDFDFDDYRSNAKKPKINNFKCFVDRMLFFHNTTSVDKFRLKCGRRVDAICFQRWMSAAVWRGVKHLDLNIFVPKFTASPAVLLTCRTLVTLKLDTHLFDFVLNDSNRICLPNLKTLHLKHLKSKEFPNDDSVKSLVSGCISLEDLVMEYCTMNKIDISHKLLKRLTILSSKRCSSVAIDTPALAYFKYIDRIARTYSLKNLESLVRADIEFVIKDNDLDNFFSVAAFATAFFGGIIDNVQSLNLSFTSLKLLIDGCKPLPIFPKLVHLR